jgi:hypothetical protein
VIRGGKDGEIILCGAGGDFGRKNTTLSPDFNPNRLLGFYKDVGTGQENLGFVLQLNRLFPADLADFRRNWCLSSIA